MAAKLPRRNVWLGLQVKAPDILGWFLFVCFVGALLFLVWHRWHRPVLEHYEGTIVERWAGYTESEEGSHPYFRLLIETGPDQRITVLVDPETYGRAQVGMGIKKTAGAIELFAKPVSSPINRGY